MFDKLHTPKESTTVSLENPEDFKRKALVWANRFRVVCCLDSNDYKTDRYSAIEWILAVDVQQHITLSVGQDVFKKFAHFQSSTQTDIFGFLSYDLKNEIERLESNNADNLHFPDLFFFQPRYLLSIKGNQLTLNRNYPETFEIVDAIRQVTVPDAASTTPILLKARCNKQSYTDNVKLIQQQITSGDFYEMNYCVEFYNADCEIKPHSAYENLNRQTLSPFSTFFKLENKYLLCASPERFLKKVKSKLIAQPMKGTIRKGATIEENKALQNELKNNPKEQAENVMIVDLVRNDLAKSSKTGTVDAEELFGVYDFKGVNQMISTVVSEWDKATPTAEIIKNAFPMGSMTGAPKIEVMKNIEQYEDFKRGLFSGAVGYLTPDGDFDFNVVIRSIFYNAANRYLSVRAGSAITYDSNPEQEWEELNLKINAMLRALNASIISD